MPELTAEESSLLERVAARVVELRMELPAILTLETALPLSMVAGQAMIFFEPFVAALFRMPDYRRFAKLIERREAIAELTRLIETRAETARDERRAAAAERREARRPAPPRT